MKQFSKLGSILLVLALLAGCMFTFAGCGQTDAPAEEFAPETEAVVEEAPAEETVEEPAEEVSVAGDWTMTFDSPFGEESFTFTLNDDGTCVLASSNTLMGPWSGTYSYDGESVTVEGLNNPEAAMGSTPDLWANWIESGTGNCQLTLDPAANTFEFVEIEGAAEGGASGGASGEGSGEGSGESGKNQDGTYIWWENASYGDLDSQTFNAKMMDQPGARPVLFVVPGGAFRFVDNMRLNDIYDYFVEQGYLVFQINYTVGENAYPQSIIDVKTAIQYVVNSAGPMHADTGNMSILGCSAGGYLAAMAAFTNSDEFVADGAEDYTYSIKSLVDFFGATQWMTEDYLAGENSPEASWIGGDIASAVEELDPLNYLEEGDVEKVWVSHGSADTTMDIGQSEQFYDGCVEVLGEDNVHFEVIEGAAHEGAAFYTTENFALVDAFISGE